MSEADRTHLTNSAVLAPAKPCSRARLRRARLVDLLGAAVAGAGLDCDRGRAVPRAVLARPLADACRRSAAPIGLFVFFVLAVAATVPLFQVRWPSAIEGLRRLDRKSLLPHRPATAIADRMAPEAGDPVRGRALARASGARAARGPRAEGRNAGARRSPRAILMRCARWCRFWWSRRSLPPAASAPSASPRRSTGTAW